MISCFKSVSLPWRVVDAGNAKSFTRLDSPSNARYACHAARLAAG